MFLSTVTVSHFSESTCGLEVINTVKYCCKPSHMYAYVRGHTCMRTSAVTHHFYFWSYCYHTALSSISDVSSTPMSPWNDDALVSLRERLKLNVSMNTGLTKKLEKAAGGFMSRHEAQMVRALSSNSEQIDKVIETLRRKTNKDFVTFCAMLRETNHVVWSVELEKEAERFKKGGKGTCRRLDSDAVFII